MGKTYSVAPRVEFEALPTGEYVLTLLEVLEKAEERDTNFSKRGDIRLEFHWEVEVPGEDAVQRRDWSSIPKTFSAKSKFVSIAIALGLVNEQVGIDAGCSVDFDQGLGKGCLGTIVRKMKDGSSEWTDQITGYAPLSARSNGRSRRAAPTAKPAVDEADIPF